jgi:hypothetical protein
MPKYISDKEFIDLWSRLKSPQEMSKATGITIRAVYSRRENIESKLGIKLKASRTHKGNEHRQDQFPSRLFDPRRHLNIQDGTICVASDAHYWPGIVTIAHQAFVNVIKDIKPNLVVMNGDILDGARISRHDPTGYEEMPPLKDEIDAVKTRLGEIKRASKDAVTLRTMGNHDLRMGKYLAKYAPEIFGIEGFMLEDHLKDWPCSWSILVNNSILIKHRWHNGVHATYNNVLKSHIGEAIVTGHLHRLMVTPYTDYHGQRKYGVDTGTLADIHGPQFAYTEDNPVNWASGFVVLTIRDGMMLPPEICEVRGDKAWFRGEDYA